MNNEQKTNGFSLTEVLISIGILGVGMLFIAGVFPVALHFTNITSERTLAAVIADQAFAKIQLYARGNPNDKADDIKLDKLKPYSQRSVWLQSTNSIDPNDYEDDILPAISDEFRWDPTIEDPYQYVEFMRSEMTYPSDDAVPIEKRDYYWSPLFRRLSKREGPDDPNRLVQVTVFVCRRKAPNLRYFQPDPEPNPIDVLDRFYHGRINWSWTPPATRYWPQPVKISVIRPPTPRLPSGLYDKLRIYISPEEVRNAGRRITCTLINEGSIIVDDRTGQRYRVLERYKEDENTPWMDDEIILLDRPWEGRLTVFVSERDSASVWVIPPPVRGGKSPCIGVYQRVIRF